MSNGSDCGILAIVFAYDICSDNDPKYDHRLIRQYLLKCLEDCNISHFPLIGRSVKTSQSVDLHCCCRMPKVEGDEIGLLQCLVPRALRGHSRQSVW